MSYCRKEGKDTVVFTTKEDHEKPSTVQIGEPEPNPGLIFPDGSINWNCPCLGGMATGPCGVEFRGAFECFHYSSADPKGSDCFGKFQGMQDCFAQYPKVYDREDEDKDPFQASDSDEDKSLSSKKLSAGGGKREIDNTMHDQVDGVVEKK